MTSENIDKLLFFVVGVLQHTAMQHTATHCSTLQHTATHYNTLQYTATHVYQLLFFVVGVLCVEMFGYLCIEKLDTRHAHAPGLLDRCLVMDPAHLVDFHASFANLMDALLTLFRISTR